MTRPVLTVTLNPAIDQTIVLGTLQPGAVHRAQSARFDAGGKGVNVASCLADWGEQVVATGILGDANDGVFRSLFATKGVIDRFVRIPGNNRTNIKLVHAGDTTDINLPGCRRNLFRTARKLAQGGALGFTQLRVPQRLLFVPAQFLLLPRPLRCRQ